MHPILIDLGFLELPMYGVLLAAAFLAALWLLVRLARGEGIDPDHISNLWVAILLAGLVGAKLTLYVVEWQYYWENPGAILATWRSAGVYYGGFVAAAVTAGEAAVAKAIAGAKCDRRGHAHAHKHLGIALTSTHRTVGSIRAGSMHSSPRPG